MLQIARMPKTNGSRCRTVVFTQGIDETVVVHNGMVRAWPQQQHVLRTCVGPD